jgi:gas vesicle protein
VGTAVAFLLIGLGVGAALGMLLAPKSGRQMRKDLRRSYEDALETISDWTDEAKDRFDEAVEKGADFADELRAKAEPLTDLLRKP